MRLAELKARARADEPPNTSSRRDDVHVVDGPRRDAHTQVRRAAGGGWGGGAYSFVACLSHLTIDHASLSRRSTVLAPNRDTSNIWALITLLPCTT